MEPNTEFLTPVLALVAWTLVMWVWMYATRIPAMQKAGIDPQDAAHVRAVADRIPSSAQRVADNYNHLHEAPTIFYALMFFAALTGGADSAALTLAWTYVALRVVHSFVQSTFNKVMVRFLVFAASTSVLMVFAGREVLRVL
jgi:hypothetical protein